VRRFTPILAGIIFLLTPLWAGRSFPGLDATVTAVSTTGGTATFTATNSFTSGLTAYLQGFSGGCTSLNGTVVTVLPTGLTGSAFEATVSGTPSCSGQSANASANLVIANGMSTPLDISSGNETVSFWWYPTNVSTTQAAVAHYIFSTAGGQFAVGLGYGTGSANQFTWAVGCCGSVTGTSYGNCSATVTANQWYQIVLWSVNGSQTGLIVNGGSFCNTFTAWDGANISAGGTNFTIGGQGNGLYPASGRIAEVAVWNNLPSGFRAALATMCPAGPSARRMGLPAPAGYFPLWGASGSTIEPDLSGNALNGTLGGPPSAANHPPCTP
jgi:hypothetical protein